jgi:tetratricopeptide (TPR) repeat protein
MRSPMLAIPTLRLLTEQDPNDIDVAVRLAETYVNSGDPQKAIELLNNRLSTCPDAVRRNYEVVLAIVLYRNNKKSEAESIFSKLYQAEPDDPAPLLAQVRLLSNDKLWNEISQKVADWCRKHPNDVSNPVAIAGMLAVLGENEAKQIAESILNGVMERNPKSSAGRIALAMLLQATGRPAEAVPHYQRVIDSEPNNAIAINNLAWIICEEAREPRKALELAERGLRLAPQYIDLIDTRGVIYFRLGEHEKALRDFERCLKLYQVNAPAGVATRFHIARTLIQLKRDNEAREQLKQALDLNNRIGGLSQADLDEAKRLLEQLQKGT